MIIILVLVGMTVASYFILKTAQSDAIEFVGCSTMVISGILLLMSIIALPVSHMTVMAEIGKFKAVQETVINTRATGNMEQAALNIKIAEANSWLAETKYYRTTIFRDFVPSEIETLEPIR
jgi:hypothetical protein